MIKCKPRVVEVHGAGPIGLTCAKILSDCGWSVSLFGEPLAISRPIALPAHTIGLIQKIWGEPITSLCESYPLESRLVAWSGIRSDCVEVSGVSIDTADLCSGLFRRLSGVKCADIGMSDPESYVIQASGSPKSNSNLFAGERQLRMWKDVPSRLFDYRHAEILTGSGFWMFLLPTGKSKMSVQIASPNDHMDVDRISKRLTQAVPNSLSHSLIDLISDLTKSTSTKVGIAPKFGSSPASAIHLAAGDRAITFDPVSGDGTGQGIRSAVLSTAALNSLHSGQPSEPILQHISMRYAFAMKSHLQHCLEYYQSIIDPEPWVSEVKSMKKCLYDLPMRKEPPETNLRLTYDNYLGPQILPAQI